MEKQTIEVMHFLKLVKTWAVFAGLLALTVFSSCQKESTEETTKELSEMDKLKLAFKDTINDQPNELYVLENKNGMVVTITNYGARIVSINVPDKNGDTLDVALGYNSLKEYTGSDQFYYGSIIGRYGNRIDEGRFELDGETYELAQNNGPNALHGGPGGFHNVMWRLDKESGNSVTLKYRSPDMEEGYPGNLDVVVSYTLTDDNAIDIAYEATTDKKTVLNITNHSFFNLKGEANDDINDHVLQIMADQFTPVDSTLIPLGAGKDVTGTPFDFREPTAIGARIEEEDEQLKIGNGYDHNFILNKGITETPEKIATVYAPTTGVEMEVFTTEPAVQFYGGNFMDSDKGKSGVYVFRGAFCLETQHYPDSPNHPDYPTTELDSGQVWKSETSYKFGIHAQ
ncbi:aldose epimerase family protein [Chondrinema litorale]|uniref:aldose epimerase family protein n=1 Tax=Chondrinema litorale TaxID=2994555 RepID=UPI002542AF00|nr:aldose epimerase family protein [Chondrinema litorale]UZR96989.1 galactose mutarotase [Chondrinema litorale]